MANHSEYRRFRTPAGQPHVLTRGPCAFNDRWAVADTIHARPHPRPQTALTQAGVAGQLTMQEPVWKNIIGKVRRRTAAARCIEWPCFLRHTCCLSPPPGPALHAAAIRPPQCCRRRDPRESRLRRGHVELGACTVLLWLLRRFPRCDPPPTCPPARRTLSTRLGRLFRRRSTSTIRCPMAVTAPTCSTMTCRRVRNGGAQNEHSCR